MAKRGSWRDRLTRFGSYVVGVMDARGVGVESLCTLLGTRRETFARMMTSKHQQIYLWDIFKIAERLEVSPVDLMLLLYNEQAIATHLSQEEKRLHADFLAVFTLFSRLSTQEKETAMKLLESLPQNAELVESQEELLKRLRVSPSYGSGHGQEIEERIKKNATSPGGTEDVAAFPKEATRCPHCSSYECYGWQVKRSYGLAWRHRCKDCGVSFAGGPVFSAAV